MDNRLLNLDLVVNPADDSLSRGFDIAFLKALDRAVAEVSSIPGLDRSSWDKARAEALEFKPLPWFLWLTVNLMMRPDAKTEDIPDVIVHAIRRLLFAAASDVNIGSGRKINRASETLACLEPGVIAAVCVIYGTARRLADMPNQRIWRVILDDAVVKAVVGYCVGRKISGFGSGRGMLCGFSTRMGLAVQVACGDEQQAVSVQKRLASGASLVEIGSDLYQSNPWQVGSMVLAACGCGVDSVMGTALAGTASGAAEEINEMQRNWLYCTNIVEYFTGAAKEPSPDVWTESGIDASDREEMGKQAASLASTGHQMGWLVG